MESNKFYRSRTDKVFAGVCGGLAEHFVIDSVLIRLLFLVLIFAGGGGLIAYIVLWIITPEKPIDYSQFKNSPTMENQETKTEEPQGSQDNAKNDPFRYPPRKPKGRGNLIGGLVLITLGALFLADEFIPHVSFGDLWPLILVVIGIGLLINSFSGRKNNP
ncbi:MAG: PspC domain-containing protein [Bacteroidetes bacterium]|nr:PspC domain-containing protein [Bacteroidota bacterium]